MLGMSALAIETDEWACATSRAAGHECLQADVAALDPASLGPVWGVIGSPPCQAYSSAGKGLGRQDKPLVIACAHELAAGNDSRQERLAQCRDSRSLLTVEPLRYVLALRPRWVALEQVPAVLELWSVFAELLAAHGYHTATGVLSAERYGVPQTRKRAFLIASLDGPVQSAAADAPLIQPAPTRRGPRGRGWPSAVGEHGASARLADGRSRRIPASKRHAEQPARQGRHRDASRSRSPPGVQARVDAHGAHEVVDAKAVRADQAQRRSDRGGLRPNPGARTGSHHASEPLAGTRRRRRRGCGQRLDGAAASADAGDHSSIQGRGAGRPPATAWGERGARRLGVA